MFTYRSLILFGLFYLVIGLSWQQYEIFIYGEIKEDIFDSIIAAILAMSLTCNVWFIGMFLIEWKKRKRKK